MNRTWPARTPLVLGYAAVFALLGGLGAWSIGTEITGAVIAPGTVQVESERQIVQHPDGGVVGDILARDGDTVQAGDALLRLDGTFLQSELAVIERQLVELQARRARLMAEQSGAEHLQTPPPPTFSQLAADEIARQFEGQRSLFQARLTSLRQEQNALAEQSAQVESQVAGFSAQLAALEHQLSIAAGEYEDAQDLFGRGLVQAARVLELEREMARVQGEIGQLAAQVAEARSRQASLEIEGLRLLDTRREEAITELRDLGLSEIELEKQRLELSERLARLDLRAPVDGTVFGSRVFTVGAVVRPADAVMYVVPGHQPLEVNVRISPTDVDQVFPGQPVTLVLSAFNLRTTPEISGNVLRVSADAVLDEATGISFFEAVIVPSADELQALPDIKLRPGMPVEAFLKTDARRPITYLVQPLAVYFSRALREE